jgi:hypothetical protein
MKPVRMIALAAVASLAGVAYAQQTVPAAPTITVVPTPSCTRPGPHPGGDARDTLLKNWAKSVDNYLDCLKKFVKEQQAIAKPLIDEAKPHLEAANKAVEEHNKAAAELTAEAADAMKR